MDKNKLELLLKPFQEKCIAEGINVAKLLIKEAYPGITDSYFLDVCIPDVTVENYNSILDKTFKILKETTDEKTLDYVFTYCIVNECEEQPN
jgi:hypothetical protein